MTYDGYPQGAGPEAGAFSGAAFTPNGAAVAAGHRRGPGHFGPRPLTLSDGGRSTVTFGPPPTGRVWWVRRITIQCDDNTARAFTYIGGSANPGNLVAWSKEADFDENDPANPYFVPEGSQLIIVWDPQATPASCWVRIEYVEMDG